MNSTRFRLANLWSPMKLVSLIPTIAASTTIVGALSSSHTVAGAEQPAARQPAVVASGSTFSHGATPPSDAIVLFDGKDLSAWKRGDDGPPNWTIQDGYAEVRGGGITTREEFGDLQLHLEWAAPAEVKGNDQGRGNSGVYFQGRYEIQILDSYENPTYPDGQAAAFYGNAAPLVNASKRPGEWQTYDIIFHAPKTGPDGNLIPGSLTVFHNGVLVQDRVPVTGKATTGAPASGLVAKGPLHLQDHGTPFAFAISGCVSYDSIWSAVKRLKRDPSPRH